MKIETKILLEIVTLQSMRFSYEQALYKTKIGFKEFVRNQSMQLIF